MKIPIFNSLYDDNKNKIKTNQLDIQNLLETIIVIANDELVNLFLLKKLNFTDINLILLKLINMKEIINLSQKKPGNVKLFFLKTN
jgi:1-deoxy-D-xylulose-5-phosphate reductoisomerase